MKAGNLGLVLFLLFVGPASQAASIAQFNIGSVHKFDLSQDAVSDSIFYSTFFGGDILLSVDDRGADTCIGPEGNIYCLIWTTTHFWPLVDPYQDTFQGGLSDMILIIMSRDGSQYQYCSFLGGNDTDFGIQMEVDVEGYVYIVGSTYSSDLATTGAYDNTINGGKDAFIMKFDPWNNEMIYTTYIGGSGDDEAISLSVDSDGNVYVTGSTSSDDFNIVSGIDDTLNGSTDAFILKLNNDGTEVLFSSYLGGEGTEVGNDIILGKNNEIIVTGHTTSTDFYCTHNAYDTTLNGSDDAFVTTYSLDGGQIIASTYVGGSESDYGSFTAIDSDGNIFVTGWTQSDDFITLNAYNDEYQNGRDVFLQKLTPNLQQVLYSSFIGGVDDEEPRGIIVDAWDCVFICGGTNSNDYPLMGAFDDVVLGEEDPSSYFDCFITKFDTELDSLLFSSFLGGEFNEDCWRIVLDEKDNIVFCGMTKSPDFPVTDNAYQADYSQSSWDAFLVSLYDTGDMDGDSLLEYQETLARTNRTNPDSDADIMPDGWEVFYGLNPLVDDSFRDEDSDDLSNVDEYLHGTDPRNPDNDSDSIRDGWEVANGFDPLDANVPLAELILYNAIWIGAAAIVIVSIPMIYFIIQRKKPVEEEEPEIDEDETRSALEALSDDIRGGKDEEILPRHHQESQLEGLSDVEKLESIENLLEEKVKPLLLERGFSQGDIETLSVDILVKEEYELTQIENQALYSLHELIKVPNSSEVKQWLEARGSMDDDDLKEVDDE